ncbi:MAG: proton-conducting transporter membrane subunit [Pirellulaceae bacterium]|nr:proton-conducting transporter membrane subunit [Pirellulaceae bacterium]
MEIELLVGLALTGLTGVACLPSSIYQAAPERWRERIPLLLGILFLTSVLAAGSVFRYGPVDALFWRLPNGWRWGIYLDGLSVVMLLLISFIAWVNAMYARRYLDGDPGQGRFYKWFTLTVAAVVWMVVARDLLTLWLAWITTSLGLHQLLVFYPDRPWAVWTARKKFLISRLGDGFLAVGIGCIGFQFGTLEFTTLFAALATPNAWSGDTNLVSIAAGMLALGALTKSAQFPFHSWLPDTLETPTPVSALMHAGIINAGGFLMIRMSPLMAESSLAMNGLWLTGACTAAMAVMVMLTQTSIKRALAWSTIAQMGFMMLQCGLGAWSAALLHLVAHSLYKSHAFLSSGSAVDGLRTSATSRVMTLNRASNARSNQGWAALGTLALSLMLSFSLAWLITSLMGFDLSTKQGFVLLGLIQLLGLSHLLQQTLSSGQTRVGLRGIVATAFVLTSYWFGYLVIDQALQVGISPALRPWTLADQILLGAAASFLTLIYLLATLPTVRRRWLAWPSLYVHATNGFYLDVPVRRLTAWCWGLNSPAP